VEGTAKALKNRKPRMTTKQRKDPRITVADFITSKVTDHPAFCFSCGPASGGNAPVLINDAQYCLWCALEIAERLLSPGGKSRSDRAVEKILKARR
jgi:hypothetical protein